jgi:site-specific DNA-methyltransferase (adenine-specific)
MTETNKIFNNDCFEILPNIDDKSIDMILCDLPFGCTGYEWDKKVDITKLWEQYNRIIKDNGAILLFSAGRFMFELFNSQPKLYRYDWIWEKSQAMGFQNSGKMPMKAHENILVFYKHLPIYNPQKTSADSYLELPMTVKRTAPLFKTGMKCNENYKKDYIKLPKKQEQIKPLFKTGMKCNENYMQSTGKIMHGRFPRSVLHFKSEGKSYGGITAKPLPLLQYLIRTYTNEGAIVLDNCMGSGSTCVAAKNENRKYIGIEINEKYFNIAKQRLDTVIDFS